MYMLLNDAEMAQVLTTAQVIAVVGHSNKSHRTSYQIAQYLRNVGYTVYPVNPVVNEIDGQKCYAQLSDIPERIDIVNVFRRSEHLLEVTEAAVAVGAGTVWSQLGVVDTAAAKLATDAGLGMVMDRCIKVDHMRLGIAFKTKQLE